MRTNKSRSHECPFRCLNHHHTNIVSTASHMNGKHNGWPIDSSNRYYTITLSRISPSACWAKIKLGDFSFLRKSFLSFFLHQIFLLNFLENLFFSKKYLISCLRYSIFSLSENSFFLHEIHLFALGTSFFIGKSFL